MYLDDEVDPDVLREMAIQMDEAIDRQENQRAGIRPPPLARSASTSKEKHAASSNPKAVLRLKTTATSSSLRALSTSSVETSAYFSAHSSESKPIPNIGLSPCPPPPPNLEPDFDITWDVDDTEPSKLPAKKHGSTSAWPPPSAQTKQFVPSAKRPSSPDPYDDLSFDMDVDESFLEQVGMIEQGALGTGANDKGKGKGKDKDKDTVAGGTMSHSSPSTAGRKTPSGSVLGTEPSALRPVSPSGAECNTRIQNSAERATSASSLSGSTETPMPQSTQPSRRRLPRDPSLIIISSEDEAPRRGHGTGRHLDLVRRRAHKRKRMDQDDVADSDVIDISD